MLNTKGVVFILKQRLKFLEIKITELSDYLQISRPTIYKYIEDYDLNNKKNINANIVKLFDYICKNTLIDKSNVIKYILNQLYLPKNEEKYIHNNLSEKINFFLEKKENENKIQFIKKIIFKEDKYDFIIHYILKIDYIINKKRKTEKEKKTLETYKTILELIAKEED